MIELYFWFVLDRLVTHRWSHKYVWCWRVCNKLCDVADREDRWEFA